jgi:hypothetical protein
MQGDEQVRHCGECKLNVYNISAMHPKEAEALIASHEGRLCVRYYQRRDGTVLARNCPTGLAAIRRRLAYAICFILALTFGGFSIAMSRIRNDGTPGEPLVERARSWPVVGAVVNRLSPQPLMGTLPMMGKVAVPYTTVPTGRIASSRPASGKK